MEKLIATKNDLIKEIKQKDDAIIELSKFYDVRNNYLFCIEIYGNKKWKEEWNNQKIFSLTANKNFLNSLMKYFFPFLNIKNF